jgi:hypothetical protein
MKLFIFALVSVAAISAAQAQLLSAPASNVDSSTLTNFAEARGRVASNSWREGLFASDNPSSSNTSNSVSAWTSNVSKQFTLSYDSTTSTFSWSVGNGATLTRTIDPGTGKDFVGFRFDAKSTAQAGKNNNTISLSNLSYQSNTSQSLSGVSASGANTVGQSYYFANGKAKSFTITGLATYTAAASSPAGINDDRLTFSFRAFSAKTTAPVPEPASMLALSAGVLALIRRRKKQA